MNVGRICSRRPVTVNPRLREAAELMHEKHVGFLVVVPAGPRSPRSPVGDLAGTVRNGQRTEGALRS